MLQGWGWEGPLGTQVLRGTPEAGIKLGASGMGWKVKGQVLRTPISGTHCSPRFGVWGVATERVGVWFGV